MVYLSNERTYNELVLEKQCHLLLNQLSVFDEYIWSCYNLQLWKKLKYHCKRISLLGFTVYMYVFE